MLHSYTQFPKLLPNMRGILGSFWKRDFQQNEWGGKISFSLNNIYVKRKQMIPVIYLGQLWAIKTMKVGSIWLWELGQEI